MGDLVGLVAFHLNGCEGRLIMDLLDVWVVPEGVKSVVLPANWCEGLDHAGCVVCVKPHVIGRVDGGVSGIAVLLTTVGGIDTFNMGKGDWIVSVSSAESNTGTNSVQGLMDYLKGKGMKWVAVRAGDGNNFQSQFTSDMVTVCTRMG